MILSALKNGKLWYVYTEDTTKEQTEEEGEMRVSKVSLALWHRRYGHCNKEAILKIPQLGLKRQTVEKCDVCAEGKITAPPFPKKSGKRSKGVLDLIHTDVGGKISPQSRGGAKFYVTFIDDYSQYTKVHLMKKKREVFSKFLEYQAEVECQACKTV